MLEEVQKQAPKQVRILAADVIDKSLPSKAAKLAESEFGHVNGLVINHGALAPVERIANARLEDWKKHFDINFFGAIAFVSDQSLSAESCALTWLARSLLACTTQDEWANHLHIFGDRGTLLQQLGTILC